MSLMSDIGTAIKNKFVLNDFASQSSNLLTGGGIVSVSAAWEVKWSYRFITISNGRGAGTARDGYFVIDMPAAATVITGVGGATNKTVTADGILVGVYESLYYILPVGGGAATVNANFRVVGYTGNIEIPSNWIKICTKNDEGLYIDFACGVSLRNNTSIDTNLYDVKGADVDGAVSSASTLATTKTFSATGDVTAVAQNFNGSQNVALPMVLANSGVTAGTYSKVTVDAKGRVTAGVIPTMEDIPSASYKRSVKAATTANITLSAPQTIDGIALVEGDRVLVKNQTNAFQNGIYVVNASTWTRSLDSDTSYEIAGGVVNVDSGTINGGILYTTNFKTTDTLGTTSMNWYKVLDDSLLLTSTSALVGAVKYNGTVAANGNFYGGTAAPIGSARLNYGGYFYPSYINLTGSADTTTTSTHVFVETGSDGFVRPKTLSNFKTEMFTSPALTGTPTAPTASTGTSTEQVATTQFVNTTNIGDGTTSFNGFGGSGFKNKLINGDFRIWQRGTNFTSFGYTADRWIVGNGGTTGTPAVFLGTNPTTKENMLVFSASNLNVTGYVDLAQHIEDMGQFKNGEIFTVSYRYASSVPTANMSVIVQFMYDDGVPAGWSAQSQQIPLSSSITAGSFTFISPFDSAKTRGTNNRVSVIFRMTGSEANGKAIDLYDVQVESGSVVTPFERRPYGLELSLCQRYYQNYDNQIAFSLDSKPVLPSYATHNLHPVGRKFILVNSMRVSPTVNYSSIGSGFTNIGIGASKSMLYVGLSSSSTWSDGNENPYIRLYNCTLDAEIY